MRILELGLHLAPGFQDSRADKEPSAAIKNILAETHDTAASAENSTKLDQDIQHGATAEEVRAKVDIAMRSDHVTLDAAAESSGDDIPSAEISASAEVDLNHTRIDVKQRADESCAEGEECPSLPREGEHTLPSSCVERSAPASLLQKKQGGLLRVITPSKPWNG